MFGDIPLQGSHPFVDRFKGLIHSATASMLRLVNRVGIGTLVWERGDWDVLIIVDACRYDLLEDVGEEYLSSAEVSLHTSVASYSLEFMTKHFTDDYAEEMSETMLIAANPYTDEISTAKFAYVDEVWRDCWDEDFNTVRPSSVIDRALPPWRHRDRYGANQLIVWLMQPHRPFRSRPEWMSSGGVEDFGSPNVEKVLWDRLRDGELDPGKVWDAYVDNLEYALTEIQRFVRNADGSIVVTSDHGNAFGELGFWGHPGHIPIPELRQVPWIEFDGQGQWTFEADEDAKESVDADSKKLLQALGYHK